MIRRGRLVFALLTLILNAFLWVGCTVSNNSSTAVTPTMIPVSTEGINPVGITPSDTRAAYQGNETPIATSELVPTNSPSPVTTPASVIAGTPTVEPTVGIEATIQPARICSATPTRFDTRAFTGIYDQFSQISFLDDQTIAFSGWAQRASPRPEVIPTSATPVTVSNSGIPSAWVELKQAQLNVTNAGIITQTPNFAPLLGDPCHGECLLDIISRSPDGKWQLVQVSAGVYDELGFWLVGQDKPVQLVNFVPTFSTWQWASDSSMLWFVHSLYEYGFQPLLVQLDTPSPTLLTDERGENPLFDATRYVSAFDPTAKTVLLTVSEEAGSDTDELLTFDLIESYTQASSIKVVAGIKGVVWNEATQDYLLVIIQEDGLAITNLDGQILVKVPIEIFESMFPGLSTSNLPFDLFLPNNSYALSPSGRYLAVGYSSIDGIYIFECQESPIP